MGFIIVRRNAAQGDLPDVSMAEEDFNVGEETINVSDTEVEKTIDVDIENTIELRERLKKA